MAAQTLKTIPEETVAPATPERVTFDVPKTKPATAKNPSRVASGKNLAERHRLARKAKKYKNPLQIQPQRQVQQITPPQKRQNNQSINQSSNNSTNTVYLILTVGGLIVSAFGVYYQREAIMKTLGRSQKAL